ncbi:phosphoribosylformylglycinamidine synthase II, partial [Staphylococcus nepalensis]
VGKGGLLISLARISAHYGLGVDATLDVTDAQLFSESQGRYIVAVKAGQSLDIPNAQEIGTITEDDKFKVTNGQTTVEENVSTLNEIWEGAIPQCMTSAD